MEIVAPAPPPASGPGATLFEVKAIGNQGEASEMPTGPELIRRVKEEIEEVDPRAVREGAKLNGDAPVIVDVRDQHEWDEGHIPGAVHVPRGHLESRIEGAAPNRHRPVVLYCASGNRSALAAHTLQTMLGYEKVASMTGGITLWKDRGYEVEVPRRLSDEQRSRYSRHLLLPEVGLEGQLKLLDAKVLLLGAGGLGSPTALYLAAAGVGTLGVVDDDEVDLSNLQRQVIHASDRIGVPKVDSAAEAIGRLNPDVEVVPYKTRLDASNVMEIIEGYDVVVDGVDNFPTRYLLNDASVRLRIPVVSASILGFDGQLSIFAPYEGPCYRCLYPTPPPAELAPSCGANGVLGVLPGVMGLLQATEVIKRITGQGDPLIGRLLLYDALAATFTELKVRRDPDCPICSRDPADIAPEEMGVFPDYEAFCAG
jgi:molybdopterin/thiamine biosynthesis adenylyltransferase/rhodanese-related sulfurtransferase